MSTKTKHTAGPWVEHNFPYGYGLAVVTNPPKEGGNFMGQIIASRTTCPDWEANARLIAAAPDLLDALEAILEDHRFSPLSDKVFLPAIAAIKKARGE